MEPRTQIGMGTCIAATDVAKAMSVKKERKGKTEKQIDSQKDKKAGPTKIFFTEGNEGNEVLRVDLVDLVDGEVSGLGGEHFSRTRTMGRRCRLFAEARGAAVD